jgi:hypothetical protein
MKTPRLLIATAMVFIFGSCAKENPELVNLQAGQKQTSTERGASGKHFTMTLSGGQEVPPNTSSATGQGIFHLRNNGTELHYRLIVANIENVSQAHIHIGAAGVNGPVAAWLYPSAPPAQLISGPVNGVLAAGVITSANLVGPLAGMDLSDLMVYIFNHEAYVNVHTSQYPGGEIRGQF